MTTQGASNGCGCGGAIATGTPVPFKSGDCGCGCGGACGCSTCAPEGYTKPRFFAGQLLTEDGPFASDTVTNTYANRLRSRIAP